MNRLQATLTALVLAAAGTLSTTAAARGPASLPPQAAGGPPAGLPIQATERLPTALPPQVGIRPQPQPAGRPAMAPPAGRPAAAQPSLLQVALEVNSEGPFAGEFDTLIELAGGDAQISAILVSRGQHTVFAPTDAAFDDLFEFAEENCIALTPDLVNAVLKYHVAPGRRDAAAILGAERVNTLLGAFFAQAGGILTDNTGHEADIIATDIFASNGVIHAIDAVLLPFPVESQCEAGDD